MLCVGYRVPDDLAKMVRHKKTNRVYASHILKEYFKNTTSFFINQTGDTLNTTTTCKTTDGWLRDTCSTCKSMAERENTPHTLNIVTKNLTMTFSTALSETLR
jgi:hypothetical protein